ncbi:DUF2490 domain-containing protein [Salinimicrobium sp. CDJ15-81-2]|nr:DUF2490 domain-containing protein [Salinimicrobium nanhaiense]
MSKKAFFPLLLFHSLLLTAQNPEELLGTWTEVIGQNYISEKWSIPTTAILQHYEVLDKFQFILLRSGVNYHFSSKASAAVGYDYFYSEGISGEMTNLQHRVWEELSLKSNFSAWNIGHRFRFESTWTRQEPEYSLAYRLRYRLKLEHPLYKKWYVTGFNEIFINLKEPVFNQNRLHLGVGYAFHPDLKFELGYFKNHFRQAHYDRIRIGIVFRTRMFSRKE